MAQEQIRHQSTGGGGDDTPVSDLGDGGQVRRQQMDADLDSLLGEIDGVLETNAEEFVKGFVQKGGQ